MSYIGDEIERKVHIIARPGVMLKSRRMWEMVLFDGLILDFGDEDMCVFSLRSNIWE